MKHTVLYDTRIFRWIFVLTLVVSRGECQPELAVDNSVSVVQIEQQINELVQSRDYAQAARLCDSLGQVYHNQYGYNKHSLDAYFKGLHYYGLLGDSVGYYTEYIVIGDYYTHDYFMQGTAERYLHESPAVF